ncbi:MAG: dihydropteroate synthase [Mariprofundales bacterium]|nr:dihydropteroate synthase [Mariprofundales bacterium]
MNAVRDALRKPESQRWRRRPGAEAAIMGVLNCTPNSFSDGGQFINVAKAVAHGLAMQRAGADIIDIGGESTRPGAAPVALDEELARVLPCVDGLVAAGCTVSIDSSKAEVIRQAVAAGATMINDVSALTADSASMAVAADCTADICLMHMQGDPTTMQYAPHYDDPLTEVIEYLRQRVEACLAAGISRQRLLVDPGIGFGKTVAHNLALLRGCSTMRTVLELPLLIGLSRKSFLGQVTGLPVEQRDHASALMAMVPLLGGCDIIRVHAVALHRQACKIAAALE